MEEHGIRHLMSEVVPFIQGDTDRALKESNAVMLCLTDRAAHFFFVDQQTNAANANRGRFNSQMNVACDAA